MYDSKYSSPGWSNFTKVVKTQLSLCKLQPLKWNQYTTLLPLSSIGFVNISIAILSELLLNKRDNDNVLSKTTNLWFFISSPCFLNGPSSALCRKDQMPQRLGACAQEAWWMTQVQVKSHSSRVTNYLFKLKHLFSGET